MNKALLLSIKPEHAIKILKGEKTLELRKSVPKGFKGWVYVYVTKGQRLSVVHDDENGKTYYYLNGSWGRELNGTIPFRFWFDEYSFMERFNDDFVVDGAYDYNQLFQDGVHPSKICLTPNELEQYGKGKPLYAWHIKQLDIFYEPMWLSEFEKEEYAVMPNGVFPCYQPLTKAPQSYQYVWVKEELK